MKKAAEGGEPGAMVTLGRMYVGGEAMPQDFAKGVEWFRTAAELGNRLGMYNFGVHTARGLGTPQSDEIAAIWLRRAMEAGYWRAKKELERLQGTAELPEPRVIATEATRLDETRYGDFPASDASFGLLLNLSATFADVRGSGHGRVADGRLADQG